MAKIGFGNGDSSDFAQYEQVKEKVMGALKEHFRPEFLNRLDDIVMFEVLSRDVLGKIVEKQVAEIVERLAAKRITLSIAPEVRVWLSGKGYNPQYGARPLKRVIQDKILTPVATLMVGQGVMEVLRNVDLVLSNAQEQRAVIRGQEDRARDAQSGRGGVKVRSPIFLRGARVASSCDSARSLLKLCFLWVVW